MDTIKLKNLNELAERISWGSDIEFWLHGNRYNISPGDHGTRFIALCPDGDAVYYNNADTLLDHNIDGIPLRDQWQDVDIESM